MSSSLIGSPVIDDPANNMNLEIGAHVQPFLDWPSHRDPDPGIGVIVSRGPRTGIAVVKWTKQQQLKTSSDKGSTNNITNTSTTTTTIMEHRAGAGGAYDLVYCEAPASSMTPTPPPLSPSSSLSAAGVPFEKSLSHDSTTSSAVMNSSTPPPLARLETERPESFHPQQNQKMITRDDHDNDDTGEIVFTQKTSSITDEDVTHLIHASHGKSPCSQERKSIATHEQKQSLAEKQNDDDEDEKSVTNRTSSKLSSSLSILSSPSSTTTKPTRANNNINNSNNIIPSCMVDPNDDLLNNEENLKKVLLHPTSHVYGVVFAQKLSPNCWVKPGIDWKGRKEANEKKGITVKVSPKSPGKVVVKWLDGRTTEHSCGANNLFELSYCEQPTGSDCFAVPQAVVTESNCTTGSYVVAGPDWKWGRQNEPGGVGQIIRAKGDGWVLVKWIISGYLNSYRLSNDDEENHHDEDRNNEKKSNNNGDDGGNQTQKQQQRQGCADLKYISREEALDLLEKTRRDLSSSTMKNVPSLSTSDSINVNRDNSNNNNKNFDEQTVPTQALNLVTDKNRKNSKNNRSKNENRNNVMMKQRKDAADSSDDDSRSFDCGSSSGSSGGRGIDDADDDDDEGFGFLAMKAREKMRQHQKQQQQQQQQQNNQMQHSSSMMTMMSNEPSTSVTSTSLPNHTQQQQQLPNQLPNQLISANQKQTDDTSSFIPEPKEHLAGQIVVTTPPTTTTDSPILQTDESVYCDFHWVSRGPDWKYSESEFKGGGVTLRTDHDGYVYVRWLNVSDSSIIPTLEYPSSSNNSNNGSIRRFRAGAGGAYDLQFCKKSESGYVEKKQFMLYPPDEEAARNRPSRTSALLLPQPTTTPATQQPTEYRPKWSTKTFKYYCGLRYCQDGDCQCSGCNGFCGPNNGCQCPLCATSPTTARFCGADFVDEDEPNEKKRKKICGPLHGHCEKCYSVAFPMVAKRQIGEISHESGNSSANVTSPLSSSTNVTNTSTSSRIQQQQQLQQRKYQQQSSNTNFGILKTSSSSAALRDLGAGETNPTSPIQKKIPLPHELQDLPHTIIYDESSFKIVRKIGKGGGGDVFEAELIANKARVAVKIFSDTSIDLMTGMENPFWIDNVRECKRLFHLNHKNIIKFIGIFVCRTPEYSNSAYLVRQQQQQQQQSSSRHYDPNDEIEDDDEFSSSSSKNMPLQLGMIMELADSNLNSLLMEHQQKFKRFKSDQQIQQQSTSNVSGSSSISSSAVVARRLLPPSTIESYTLQIASGLEYLHSVRTLWLDAKPHNVLVLHDAQILRLADFGLSQLMSGEASVTRAHTPGAGTYRYISPESVMMMSTTTTVNPTTKNGTLNDDDDVKIDQSQNLVVGPKNDVYSFGCILFFLLTGDQPWEEFGNHLRTVPNQTLVTPLFEQVRTKVEEHRKMDGDGAQFHQPEQYLVDLCVRCLSLDPKLRPTASEIVKAIKMKNAFPFSNDDDDEDGSDDENELDGEGKKKKKTGVAKKKQPKGNDNEHDPTSNGDDVEQSETFRAFGVDDTNYRSSQMLPMTLSTSFGSRLPEQ